MKPGSAWVREVLGEVLRTDADLTPRKTCAALLPDADVIAFALRIPYSAPWGHRGASHSLAIGLLTGFVIGLLLSRWFGGLARTVSAACLAVLSHGLLDTLTDSGLGVALLWPYSLTRFFAPIQPLPVAPIGFGLLSDRGLHVLLSEAIAFLPLWAYALWPRTRS